jgi:hypothetical protein
MTEADEYHFITHNPSPAFPGPRLGRKKAADPRDLNYLAKDQPKLALVCDPRDSGVLHPSIKAKLRQAGMTLAQRATAADIPIWAADLPKLSRSHIRSPLFPLWQNGYSACVGFTLTELALAGPIMQRLEALATVFGTRFGAGDNKDIANLIGLEWYRRAQKVDEWDGEEPAYYGTSGRAGAKVGQSLGLWPNYFWLTNLQEVVRYLILHGPVAIGVDVFTSDLNPTRFVKPGGAAILKAEGAWEGGHEMLVDYVNIKRTRIGGPQSWGEVPAQSPYSRWEMDFSDLEYRLSQGGDALAIPEVRLPR